MTGLGPILAAIRDLVSLDVRVERIEKDVDEIRKDSQEIKHMLGDYLRHIDRVSARQERFEEIIRDLEDDLSQRVIANVQAKMVAVQAEVDLVREQFRRGILVADTHSGDRPIIKNALE